MAGLVTVTSTPGIIAELLSKARPVIVPADAPCGKAGIANANASARTTNTDTIGRFIIHSSKLFQIECPRQGEAGQQTLAERIENLLLLARIISGFR